MRASSIAGVLAVLAGLGLAGLAGADGGDDCLAGAAPLPGGHFAVCLLEENDGAYEFVACNAWECARHGGTFASNALASASVEVLGPGVATARAEASQSEGTWWYEGGAWSGSRGSARHDTTHVGVSHSVGDGFLGTSGGAGVSQHHLRAEDCSRWGCTTTDRASTGVSVSRQFGIAGNAGVEYVQASDHGGPCREVVAVQAFFLVARTPEQPCAVEVPHLMDDPATRFPDWPDGTGLPFL